MVKACRLVLLLICAALLAPAMQPTTARAAARQSIWLHYDYMVGADGTSRAPDPKGIELVVQAFAAHGIDLHIDPQHTAIPALGFVYFDVPVGPGYQAPACGGLAAVNFSTLKNEYFHPISNHEWHYAMFTAGICGFGSGIAQLPGDYFALAIPPAAEIGEPAPYIDGAVFMHELGHNLGLHHGGDSDVNYKPNYLSVMNYWFNLSGIPYAASPGSTKIAGYRLDYSEQKLPALDEHHLDERQGLGAPGSTDISVYCDPTACAPAPANGPVDWNHNGVIEPDVSDDLDYGVCADPSAAVKCGYEQMSGFDDWAEVHAYLAGQVNPGPRTFAIEPPSDQPLVTGASPATGLSTGGTVVTITGVHLKDVDHVNFGPCPAASFTVVDEHTITATTPNCDKLFNSYPASLLLQTTPVDITVAAGGSLSPDFPAVQFTYIWPYPVITSMTPLTIFNTGGARVTIKGRNFTGTSEVDFSSSCGAYDPYRQPHFTVLDDSTIVIDPTVNVPCHDVGLFNLPVIHNPYGSDTRGQGYIPFNLADPPPPVPTVTSISPVGGTEAGGTLVVVRGSGFASAWLVGLQFGPWGAFCTSPIIVRFGNSRSGCGADSSLGGNELMLDDDTLLVTAPPGTGTVDVTVTNATGTSATGPADQFTYGSSPPTTNPPRITGVSPVSGDRGSAITINGTDLAQGVGPPTVDFYGCLPVPATANSDGSVTVTVPACADSGEQTLQLTNEGGFATMAATSIGNFTVTGDLPTVTITGFLPTSGPPGTVVTIMGNNIGFLPEVDFGCSFFEATANPDGTLTATVPSCAQSGPIEVNGPRSQFGQQPALNQPIASTETFTVTR